MTFTDLASVPSDPSGRSLTGCGWQWPPTWPASRAPPVSTPNPTCAATWPGAPSAAWTRWPPSARIWSCTSGGCRRSAGSSPPPCPGGSRSTAGFYRTCVIDGVLEHSPAEHVRRPAVPAESPTLGFTHLQFEALLTAARESAEPVRLRAGGHARPARLADLRSHQRGHRRPRRRARPPGAAGVRQGHQGRPGPAAATRSPGPSTGQWMPYPRAILLNSRGARMDRHAATRRLRRLAASRRYPGRQGTPAYASPYVRHDHAKARSCIRCNIPRPA